MADNRFITVSPLRLRHGGIQSQAQPINYAHTKKFRSIIVEKFRSFSQYGPTESLQHSMALDCDSGLLLISSNSVNGNEHFRVSDAAINTAVLKSKIEVVFSSM